MRAVVTTDFGSAPVVTEVDTPTAGPGEVRIRVLSSSLNGFDRALTLGFFRGIMEHRFPVVLGRDFAGTVDQVGAGVTAFAPGDDVFGVVLTQPLHAGGFGEYLVVPEDHSVAVMPAGLDHARAGAIGLAGSAALATLGHVAAQTGETVLVSGATGGVGAFALQLLVGHGVRVLATATPGPETHDVRQLGAREAVDHTGDLATQVRALAPDGVDVALHLAGDPIALADLVADGGRYASLLGVGPDALGERAFAVFPVAAWPNRADLEMLAAEVAAGRLTIPVERAYPLDQVPQAMDDFAAGTLGKLVISVA